ncbi:TSC22 domain family protein 1-like [Rhincodon typus]|uniref:TSC22 domain family protein 1-like n=1 Tax=Rhincodon typus TaxID=259920 RepID=UPI00202F5BDE|nr:TSC22 domain family protein 1-like [Rhincodon typus]
MNMTFQPPYSPSLFRRRDGASGAGPVAIDTRIEQAMDLVKTHLMFAVQEEVRMLKEQIKELVEKNSNLELENSLLKKLLSPEQLQKLQLQDRYSETDAKVASPDHAIY